MAIAEKYVLSSMIFGKNYVVFGDVNIDYFAEEGHKKIYEYIEKCAKESKMPIASRLYDLTGKDDADSIIDATDEVKIENQALFYKQCVKKLLNRYVDKEIKKTIADLNNETNDDNKIKLKQKIVALTHMKK